MLKYFSVISFILSTILVSEVYAQDSGTDQLYSSTLDSLLTEFIQKSKITEDGLFKLIPSTAKEYSTFIAYSDSSHFYELLDFKNHFLKTCGVPLMTKNIELSFFVDGYDADDYFDWIGKLSSENNEVFCKSYIEANVEKRNRTTSYYNAICN